jgi:hypothetical protein
MQFRRSGAGGRAEQGDSRGGVGGEARGHQLSQIMSIKTEEKKENRKVKRSLFPHPSFCFLLFLSFFNFVLSCCCCCQVADFRTVDLAAREVRVVAVSGDRPESVGAGEFNLWETIFERLRQQRRRGPVCGLAFLHSFGSFLFLPSVSHHPSSDDSFSPELSSHPFLLHPPPLPPCPQTPITLYKPPHLANRSFSNQHPTTGGGVACRQFGEWVKSLAGLRAECQRHDVSARRGRGLGVL